MSGNGGHPKPQRGTKPPLAQPYEYAAIYCQHRAVCNQVNPKYRASRHTALLFFSFKMVQYPVSELLKCAPA